RGPTQQESAERGVSSGEDVHPRAATEQASQVEARVVSRRARHREVQQEQADYGPSPRGGAQGVVGAGTEATHDERRGVAMIARKLERVVDVGLHTFLHA